MSNITQGVKDFLKGNHKADSTEVCTEVAPEVVQENVRPQEHVETAEAVDRERHIHHHQHRVQPVEAHEVKPEVHTTTTAPTVVREHKEEMLPEHQAKLHEQRTLHQPTQVVNDVERSAAHVGTHNVRELTLAASTHTHHHIHETVQPVIQKETIQPSVVHHTQGIHEKIHDAPIVHEATTLPSISHEQFLKNQETSGPHSHNDKTHSHQFYEGAPRVGGAAAREDTAA